MGDRVLACRVGISVLNYVISLPHGSRVPNIAYRYGHISLSLDPWRSLGAHGGEARNSAVPTKD